MGPEITSGISTGVALGVLYGGKWIYEKVFTGGNGKNKICPLHLAMSEKLDQIVTSTYQTSKEVQELNIKMAVSNSELKNLQKQLEHF